MARSLGVLLATTVGIPMLAVCGGSAAPAATDAPSATVGVGGQSPGPGATTTGGSGLDDPCALLTPDEVAGATASDPVTTSGTPGDPASCAYRLADGTEVLHLDVIRSGAAAHFQTFVDAGSGESVAGVGDRAYYETGTRRLLVMTGENLVMLTSGAFVDGADLTGMAVIIVARLAGGSVPPGSQITAPPVISAETACDLLTADEAAAVLGKGPMEAQSSEFAAQFCTYAVVSSGEVVLSTYLQATGGAQAWGGFEASLTTEPVTGLGDKAMFEPSTGILFVLAGDSIFNVNVFGVSPAEALELDRQLAEVMLGHL